MTKNLEDLIYRYSSNLRAIDKANVGLREDPDKPVDAKIYTDRDEVLVNAAPAQVINDARFYMSQFPEFFEDAGLGQKTWSEFLRQYYRPLDRKFKDAAILEVLGRYTTEEEREKLSKNPYITLLVKIVELSTLRQREKLDKSDLEKVLLHFTHKGKKEKELIINPYAAQAIQDYERNPNVIKAAIDMKLRLYELQKSKEKGRDRNEADRLMDYSEKDATDNYSINNYSKATTIYKWYKANAEANAAEIEKRSGKQS